MRGLRLSLDYRVSECFPTKWGLLAPKCILARTLAKIEGLVLKCEQEHLGYFRKDFLNIAVAICPEGHLHKQIQNILR